MKLQWKKIVLWMLVIGLLPLGITAIFSGKKTLVWKKPIDLENFLPMILCQQISWDYEEETLKAQAVLARSSLYLCVKNGEMTNEVWKTMIESYEKNKEKANYQTAYQRMEAAVIDTEGEVLVYNGAICEGIFHKISAGSTRDGAANLKNQLYAYVTSVESRMDIYGEDYFHGHYFTQEDLKHKIEENYPEVTWSEQPLVEQIQIVEQDSQGYVITLQLGEVLVSGEEFRTKLELSSSNFSIQEIEGKIRFLCKGLGHGFGLSQFGANQLAKEGNTYQQILNTYFPQAVIEKRNLQM